MRYFQRHWMEHPEWITAAREQMETFYMEYSGRGALTSSSESNSMRSEMDDWCFDSTNSQSQSELDEYLAAPLVLMLRGEETMESFNPVSWYKSHNGSYPILTAIAYKYMPFQQCRQRQSEYSADRSPFVIANNYSKANYYGSEEQLNTDTVEIIECLNSWRKEGILSSDISLAYSSLIRRYN
jgi:hypothetical protein